MFRFRLLALVLAAPLSIAISPTTGHGQVAEDPFVRGDVNGDLFVNIADPVASLEFLFAGGNTPACVDAADANDDGVLNVADPIFTLALLFQGGEPLPLPFPSIGTDPTPDALACNPIDCNTLGAVIGSMNSTIPTGGSLGNVAGGGPFSGTGISGSYGSSSASWTRGAINLNLANGTLTVTGTFSVSTPISGTYQSTSFPFFPVNFSCTATTSANWTYTANLATSPGNTTSTVVSSLVSSNATSGGYNTFISTGCLPSPFNNPVEGQIASSVNSSSAPENLIENIIDPQVEALLLGSPLVICD